MVQALRLGRKVGDVVELPARPGAVAFSSGSRASGGVLVQVIWRGGGAATRHPVGVLRRVEG